VSTLQHINPLKRAVSGVLPALTAAFRRQLVSVVAAISLDLLRSQLIKKLHFFGQRKTVEKHTRLPSIDGKIKH
jgi:hypothetical protein